MRGECAESDEYKNNFYFYSYNNKGNCNSGNWSVNLVLQQCEVEKRSKLCQNINKLKGKMSKVENVAKLE